jgi:hypothetical protein
MLRAWNGGESAAMAYQVQLRLKDGAIHNNFKMYDSPTPSADDIIDVDTPYGTMKARVEAVRRAHPVDFVNAVQVESVNAL